MSHACRPTAAGWYTGGMSGEQDVIVRRANDTDIEFLWAMLATAVFAPGIDVDAVRSEPALSHYLDGFDLAADDATAVALIAERAGESVRGSDGVDASEPAGGSGRSPDGAGGRERIGAAWYRRFAADDPGYGFIDEDTPELTMACIPSARGIGVGGRLLDELLTIAASAGLPGISLSVAISNHAAVHLYRRRGFIVYGNPAGGSMTMVRPL